MYSNNSKKPIEVCALNYMCTLQKSNEIIFFVRKTILKFYLNGLLEHPIPENGKFLFRYIFKERRFSF
jgi:hypothetical protein